MIFLLAHPSMSGMQSGSGTSGSTHWHNAVRSRLYLTYGEEETAASPLIPTNASYGSRSLNYGPRGKPLRLRWQNGLFIPDTGEKAAAAASANAEATFLSQPSTPLPIKADTSAHPPSVLIRAQGVFRIPAAQG